jgi:predicted nucleotidyltransferase
VSTSIGPEKRTLIRGFRLKPSSSLISPISWQVLGSALQSGRGGFIRRPVFCPGSATVTVSAGNGSGAAAPALKTTPPGQRFERGRSSRQQQDGFHQSENGSEMTLDEIRATRREEILRLAAERGARNVRVFGSVARGEGDATSDIDFLVDLEPGRSLLDLGRLQRDLERLLAAKVDVVSARGLRTRVRQRILRDAVAL